jgi:hypothetical protein
MATWRVEPTWKKSVIEYGHLTKDDNELIVEIGWRGGSFLVYTDDDNPPDIEAGVDIMNCGYESEMLETYDGCWQEYHYDDCDEETQAWLEEFLEDNSYFDLEEHGWFFCDTEFVIDCDLQITRVNDDGTDGESFVTGQDEETQKLRENLGTQQLAPNAAWPFGSKDEEEK